MFCRVCGTEMSDNAKFCPSCGTERVAGGKQVIEDNQIKFQLKPEFNLFYKIVTSISSAILYLFLISVCIIDLYQIWSIFPGTLQITIAITAIIIAIKLVFDKKQYDEMEYNFYATKVEYKDGFLNKEEKELKYKYVREVTMSQNILERICGIGTIKIFTNASSGMYNASNHGSMRGRNGIYIHCVENVNEQYQLIKQIIDEGTEN